MSVPETDVFDSRVERAFFKRYSQFFSLHEIFGSQILQWALGSVTFSYFVVFSSWLYNHATTVDAYLNGSYVCWPYFQDCGKLYVLRTLPEGYSQPLLYMLFFSLLVLVVYLMYRKEWTLVHLSLVPLFTWHTFVALWLSMSMAGNYDYYLILFAGILLFFPHKEFFLKVVLVLCYSLSVVTKIHPTWIEGSYFSALKTGLPLFPDWSIPFFTNLVILMEMIGVWFLLGKNALMRQFTLIFFIVFHLYSGLLVGYHYPATVLPILIILFGPLYSYTKPPFDIRATLGWTLIVTMIALQFISNVIPGDEKLTLEGNKFGLYMFEANHQCISTVLTTYRDGTTTEKVSESATARGRCDPYRYWFRIHTTCKRNSDIVSVKWTFDHSVNGGPFLRIVDVPDACTLSYSPIFHNSWIKTEYDNPQVMGFPVENIYD